MIQKIEILVEIEDGELTKGQELYTITQYITQALTSLYAKEKLTEGVGVSKPFQYDSEGEPVQGRIRIQLA